MLQGADDIWEMRHAQPAKTIPNKINWQYVFGVCVFRSMDGGEGEGRGAMGQRSASAHRLDEMSIAKQGNGSEQEQPVGKQKQKQKSRMSSNRERN